MPSGDIGWGGDAFRDLIRRVELLVLDELRETFSAFLVVVEFKEAKLSGADDSADELVHATLVLGVKKKLAILADVFLELFPELNHMLEDQLLLGCFYL